MALDESLTLLKGRLVFKQYIKSKRHRFGIKQYVLCDSLTGYVLDIVVYSGTNVDYNRDDVLGATGGLVKTMMENYSGKVGTCSTVNKYRKNMPRIFQDNKSRPGDLHL